MGSKSNTKGKRKPVPKHIEAEVAMKSRRRCCLCYYIDGDVREKQGQVAHLDDDPSNNDPDNLAWLCIPHHDRYDGTTSQSKNYTMHEVKAYRRMLFDLIAARGLTSTSMPVPVEERRREIEQRRADFERAVTEGNFNKFKADMAIMAMAVLPAVPPPAAAQYRPSNDTLFRQFFQPIGVSGVQPKTDRGTVVFSAISAVTEVRKDGSVFAVLNMKCGEDTVFSAPDWGFHPISPEKPYVVAMPTYQPWAIAAVRDYLKGLKALNISGPWYFGLSILKARNCRLCPSRRWDNMFTGGQSRPCEHDSMVAATLLLPANLDVDDHGAVEAAIRPALRDIWEHCGYPSPPSFDGDGFRFVECE